MGKSYVTDLICDAQEITLARDARDERLTADVHHSWAASDRSIMCTEISVIRYHLCQSQSHSFPYLETPFVVSNRDNLFGPWLGLYYSVHPNDLLKG